MYPGGPNPFKLQNAPGSQKTPLVLIHDGGGTTFAYFFLGQMGRDVWAIYNPNYWNKKKWTDMDEMARHYIVLIRNAGIRGPIILGGELLLARPRSSQHQPVLFVPLELLTNSAVAQVGRWEVCSPSSSPT